MYSKQDMAASAHKVVLLIEPFCGGSHEKLMKLLIESIPGCELLAMSDKKWHWRMRTSALYFARVIPQDHCYRVLLASSVLNLAELIGLRPDMAAIKKVLYFHENQLVYPVRKQQDRDFQYGYNQIISCLAADIVIFNSKFNQESFLSSIDGFLKLMPDYRPKGLSDKIRSKCKVLYYPLQFDLPAPQHLKMVTLHDSELDDNDQRETQKGALVESAKCCQSVCSELPLHIVWPHRWEHDKDPDTFFSVICDLKAAGFQFVVSVIGQVFNEVPEMFERAQSELREHILNWGYVSDRDDYLRVLKSGDVVVSTAAHEFFGVAMLEAVYCGCYPLCPNRLVYPEIFSKEHLYSTPNQLLKRLKRLCQNPQALRKEGKCFIDLKPYLWSTLKEEYVQILLPEDPSFK